jgi:hypothetical protein
MTGPDTLEDTSDDHERFETELVAQDRDCTHTSRADIGQDTAHRLVNDLVEAGIVVPVPDERVLVHDPSGQAFESIIQLAVFHRGWTAALESSEAE